MTMHYVRAISDQRSAISDQRSAIMKMESMSFILLPMLRSLAAESQCFHLVRILRESEIDSRPELKVRVCIAARLCAICRPELEFGSGGSGISAIGRLSFCFLLFAFCFLLFAFCFLLFARARSSFIVHRSSRIYIENDRIHDNS